MNQHIATGFPSLKIANSDTHSCIRLPTLSVEISEIVNIFYLSKLAATTGKFYMNHIVSGVELSSPMLVMSFCS